MNRAYRDYCRRMGEAMCRRPIFTEPTLNQEELLAVYQTAMSTDLDILRDTAVRMFPERFQEKPPHPEVLDRPGSGRKGPSTAERTVRAERQPLQSAGRSGRSVGRDLV